MIIRLHILGVLGPTASKWKAFNAYIYIQIDVYLYEVFVYCRFKAIIYTLLVSDMQQILNSHIAMLFSSLPQLKM